MTDSFVTDLPDGALPLPISDGYVESPGLVIQRQICDEVTLTITFLHRNGERIVARFDLDSPYWIDNHDAASGIWSLALPRYEMMMLLCTLLGGRMKVVVKREELLCQSS